eukprot:341620-Prorocentrum_minimum.AAC.1
MSAVSTQRSACEVTAKLITKRRALIFRSAKSVCWGTLESDVRRRDVAVAAIPEGGEGDVFCPRSGL